MREAGRGEVGNKWNLLVARILNQLSKIFNLSKIKKNQLLGTVFTNKEYVGGIAKPKWICLLV